MRGNHEIKREIKALEKIKPLVPKESEFGDDHHSAIEAQIRTLEDRFGWEEISAHFDNENDHYHALQALDWAQGVIDISPSKDWSTLTK